MGQEYRRIVAGLGFMNFGGPVCFADDFELGNAWFIVSAGAVMTRQSSKMYEGAYALKVTSPTASPAPDDQCNFRRPAIIKDPGVYVFSGVVYFDQDDHAYDVEFVFNEYTGITNYQLYLRYDRAETEWQYLDENGDPASISDFSVSPDAQNFYYFEVTFDNRVHEYVSFRIQGEYIDLSGIPYYENEDASLYYSLVQINTALTTGADSIISVYLDDVSLVKV